TRSVRGDLYRLRTDKTAAGHEQRGPRYAVAIQSDGVQLSTLIVAPTSTSAQPAVFRPEIEMDGTLTRVLIDQMRAVDASRLGDFAGRLDAAEIGEVDRAVRLILGVLLGPVPMGLECRWVPLRFRYAHGDQLRRDCVAARE